MPSLTIGEITLVYEDRGSGTAIVFCHEFAQNHTGWAPQVSALSRTHRTIAYSRTGYPPSDVPDAEGPYRFAESVGDLDRVIAEVAGDSVHLVGHGAGGNVALSFTLLNPTAVRTLTLVGAGAGSDESTVWKSAAEAFADAIESQPDSLRAGIATAPQRQAFRDQDEAGWERFIETLDRLSRPGCARAMRGALSRPSFFEFEAELRTLETPVLLVLGDQDLPAFGGSLFVLRTAPRAALAVMPSCGHTENLERPTLLNRLLADFVMRADSGSRSSSRGRT